MENLNKDLKNYMQNSRQYNFNDLFETYNIVDIAEQISELELVDVVYIFKNIDDERAGNLFTYLSLDMQKRLVDLMTGKQISHILNYVYTDDVVLFLEELDNSVARSILSHFAEEKRITLLDLLSYPKESAGSIMATDSVEIGQYISVKDATELIKKQTENVELTDTFYVTNINDMLVGVLSLRDILFAPQNKIIEEVMTKDIVSVKVFDNQEEVAKVIAKYDFATIPVCDDAGRFKGYISADDIIDVVEDEATEDIYKMGAIYNFNTPYLTTTAFNVAKSRMYWLALLTILYTASTTIILNKTNLLTLLPSLIIFIPLIMDVSGVSGSQTLAMIIRASVVDNFEDKDYFKVIFKEFGVSIIVGLILFVASFLRIYYLSANTHNFYFALIVSLTIFITVIIAKLLGVLFPVLLLYFKKDPSIVSTPLITTISDFVSLTTYLTLATLFLERLV